MFKSEAMVIAQNGVREMRCNSKIVPGHYAAARSHTKEGPVATTSLTDITYRQTVGRAAFALVGFGFRDQKIPDFAAKFDLFRDMIGMTAKEWPDAIFAALLFGDHPPSSPTTFNRKKLGHVAFTSEDAAALAQLMNFFAQVPAEERATYRGDAVDARAIAFMMTAPPGNAGLRALDLALPMLHFAARLASMIAKPDRGPSLDILHGRAMGYLNGLRSRCDPRDPVIFRRPGGYDAPSARFGGNQKMPDLPPWEWEPERFRANDRPSVGLALTCDQPCELWALTIRDPRPPGAYGSQGRYCWDESWENLARWSVPTASIPAGSPLEVDYGPIVNTRGEFSIFLLHEVGPTGRIRELLGVELGAAVPVTGLHRLLAAAADSKTTLGFSCYGRRYRVRTNG